MPARILIVEDEPAVADLIEYNLRKARFESATARDGRSALRMAASFHPDLILLDLMLPELDGLDVCRELRRTSAVPVIMLTARGEESDRVSGLELGADDYVTKPFSMRELLARIRAVLRRAPSAAKPPAAGGELRGKAGLVLNLETRTTAIGGRPLALTQLEFDLLAAFLASPNRVFSREQLLEQVWGYAYAGDVRAVDSAVKRLRARLRERRSAEEFIESVRGVGYRFVSGGDAG
jgi:DNA-binding response OmpR family regulator